MRSVALATLLAIAGSAGAEPKPDPKGAPGKPGPMPLDPLDPLADPKGPRPQRPARPIIAMDVLKTVEEHYKKAQHLTATFDQTVTRAIGGKPGESNGTLRVEKPNKIRFEYLQPKRKDPKVKVAYLFDGKTFYVLDHGNLQWAKRTVAASDLSAIVTFFLGAGSLLKDFKVAFSTDKAIVPTGVTALELVPRKPNAAYARTVLVLDSAKRVARVVIFNSSGDIQEMRFSAVELDKPVPRKTFVFDPADVAGYEPMK